MPHPALLAACSIRSKRYLLGEAWPPLPKSILLSIKLLDACSVVPALGNAFESLTFCNVARHKRVYILYGPINNKRLFYRFG